MNRTIFSFFITFLAGISTVLGIIPCFINYKYKDYIISFSLAFAAGVMLTISFLSLIPESFYLINSLFFYFPSILITFIFVVIGIIFSSIIDSYIEKKINNNLLKLGIISVIALVIHNIPEGITTFISTSYNLKLGISLSLAIALHNIPEGISIAIPIYYSTGSIKKSFFYTVVAGFSELLGALIAYLFVFKYINNLLLGIILAITAGIMIHISIYELIPNSLSYKKNKTFLIGIILGILIMFLCKYYF